jgi:hypothetical protein
MHIEASVEDGRGSICIMPYCRAADTSVWRVEERETLCYLLTLIPGQTQCIP